jgi:hypothetical protein
MKHLIFSLILLYCAPLFSREYSIAEAEINPALVNVLVLDQASNGPERLMKISSKLTFVKTVIFDQSTDTKQAEAYVSSVAACNGVRNIVFRNCELNQMPSNMKMLVSVRSLEVQGSFPGSSEAFYNTAADMNSVEQVRVRNNDFRELPQSFSRMRVMKSIDLINTDQGLASGYDINTKLPEEMISSDTVKFGFGADVLAMSYTCYNKKACNAHLQMFRDVLQGAPRASNVFYKPAREKAFLKQHPLVKRPLKNADVIPDVFTTSSLTGGIAEYGSGTKITVPPTAFVDANGKTVTGNVELTYREFRDPADIIVSGIPMKYDSGGVVGDFKSAGMFEMYASQNNQEVFVAPGKNIELQFAVTDTAPEYNFYRLDESKGWVYESSPGEVESEVTTRQPAVDTVQLLSEAVNYYNGKIRRVQRGLWLGDTTSFDRKYADTNYIGNELVKVSERWSRASKAKKFSRFYLRKYAGGKDFTCVKIERTKYGYRDNPELGLYRSYYWKIDKRMRGPELRKKYGSKAGISDVRIINEDGEYYIELKYNWGFDRVKATPVRLNADKKPIEVKDIQKSRMHRNYSRHLNARRRAENRKISYRVKGHERARMKASHDSTDIYFKTLKYMDSTESAMTRKQWEKYVASENIRIYGNTIVAAGSNNAVYQTLAISGMGIYNCDQVRRLNNPVTKVIKAINTAAGAVIPVMVYVVSKTANMVLMYYQGLGKGVEFSYGKKDVNTLVAIDKSGSVYVVDEEDFPAMADAGHDKVEMEGAVIDGEPNNAEVIRRAIFPENYE